MSLNIGICVGHSRRGDSGAVSLWGETEHAYNSKVAHSLKDELGRMGIASFVIADYEASGYTSGIRNAAAKLRAGGATHALELHFNSASASANGAEWLHYSGSQGGIKLATAMREAFKAAFPMVTDRGLKPKGRGDRGGTFLQMTHCPAIITEPFFGSNAHDCAIFQGEEERLAKAYAKGIQKLT